MTANTPVQEITVGAPQKKEILDSLTNFKGKRILIVGDIGLDEYVLGQVRRISPEAPVPVLEVDKEDKRLGLAANVAQNVLSLGGDPVLVGVVGQDTGAEMLRALFAETKINTSYLVVDGARPTTRKTRIMAQHHHVVRVDYELRRYLSPEAETKLMQMVEKTMPSCDCVIVEDYAKGVLSENCISGIVKLARKSGKRVLVDPHRTTPGSYYKGVDLLKPNFDEAVTLAGMNFEDLHHNPNKVVEVGLALRKKIGAEEIVMTQGKDGMTIFSNNKITHVPTYARQVFDVTGAGDTVIAALALGLASGMDLQKTCVLANFAAGVVVGKVGCVPCTIPELIEYIQET